MSDKKIQDLSVTDPVTFETVVATALAEGVPATAHNDKEFVVEVERS